jgi:hypothetical protein
MQEILSKVHGVLTQNVLSKIWAFLVVSRVEFMVMGIPVIAISALLAASRLDDLMGDGAVRLGLLAAVWSTEGKDDRRVEVTVVVLLHRTNLPPSVKTRPWHVRVNRLAKLPEELQLLLLTEQHLPSGGTLKLKEEFRLVAIKLLLDLSGHPIEPSGEFLLISA